MMDFSLQHQDLAITNGDLSLCATESDATAQAITIRLKTFLGEWFLDENRGLPYLTHIFGKKLNERFVKRLMTQEIKSTPGVLDVHNLTLTPQHSERSLFISFDAVLSGSKVIAINQSVEI